MTYLTQKSASQYHTATYTFAANWDYIIVIGRTAYPDLTLIKLKINDVQVTNDDLFMGGVINNGSTGQGLYIIQKPIKTDDVISFYHPGGGTNYWDIIGAII